MGHWQTQKPQGTESATPRGTVLGVLHILDQSAAELERIGLAMSAERMRTLRALVVAEFRWEECNRAPFLGRAGNDA
ncbi:hypothetical protein JYK14_24660 [Siccirubricoccus sp. KC 17139]|uniref:Uncharacterized protein n=1 Tax=Siccirubricoccus soli TaxID=2899147 RepID=A0ABT1DBL4_9PROT|nr:hypothetical protein [Siccirubricoccus soli]MCO6419328.1 hypothetical protein [Siccirubricoccus soli]MCP2685463.1 hypothetical protein [Siccirubricoccus soli]